MNALNEQIEQTILTEIPICQFMKIKVPYYDENRIVLSAPLNKNINHKNTAFGGSLFSASVLTGWGFVYGLLLRKKLTAHIVIQNSTIKYLHPITDDFLSTCEFDDSVKLEKFIKVFKRKKRARISLNTQINATNGIAVDFQGDYVIHQ